MSLNSKVRGSFFRRHCELLVELTVVPVVFTAVLCTGKAAGALPGALIPAVLLAAALGAAAAGIPFLPVRSARAAAAGRLLLGCALILTGCLYIQNRLQRGRQFWGLPAENVVQVSGTLVEDSRPDGKGGAHGRIELASVTDNFGSTAEASGTALVLFAGPRPLFQGRRLHIPAELVSLTSSNEQLVRARGRPEVLNYSGPALQRRARMVAALRERLKSVGRTAPPLLQALLLGYRPDGTGGLAALFRRAGCAHLLALSGMHLGVLSLGILVVLTPVLGRRPALVLSLLCGIGYLALVGARPSMLRAVLMYGLGVAALLGAGVRTSPLFLLCSTFLLHVLLQPQDAGTLGFQLSYLALAGICGWTPAISRSLPAFIPPGLREGVAATIAAQVCTAFLVVKHFGVLYPAGLIAPLLLTPLITLWMWSGLGYLAWSTLLETVAGPILSPFSARFVVVIDRLFRGGFEQAALLTTGAVRWLSRFRPLQIPREKWWLVALVALCVLTLFSLSQYAGRYGRRIKLQLSKFDRPVPAGEWNGGKPPLWAEFPHFKSGAREDSRAA